MTNVQCRPVYLSYSLLVNGPLNSPSNFCIFPRLFIALRNRLAFLALSFRRLLKNRQTATATHRTKRNILTSRNGPIFASCNLSSLSANIYYYLLFLPNRLLIHLQYIALLYILRQIPP